MFYSSALAAFNTKFLSTEMTYEAHTFIAPMAYTCCWQGVRSDVARWEAEQLALVRLGVANVRWPCAAPRIATPRLQMPIAANKLFVNYDCNYLKTN